MFTNKIQEAHFVLRLLILVGRTPEWKVNITGVKVRVGSAGGQIAKKCPKETKMLLMLLLERMMLIGALVFFFFSINVVFFFVFCFCFFCFVLFCFFF